MAVCYKIGTACENPIYLNWKNTLGGWDKWLFDVKQVYSLNTNYNGTFEKYVSNIETTNRIKETLKAEANEIIRLGADNLTTDNVKGLQDLFYSPRVLMLHEWNPPLSPVWIQVIPNSGTRQLYQTGRTFQAIEFEIELPKIYTLTN